MKRPSMETIANVAVVLVCALVAGVFIKNNFFATAPVAQQSLLGKTIKLDGVDIHASKITVLLALSSNCRYCEESTAFYQQLTTLRRKPGTEFQTVGVFRESVETAREYLTRKGLVFDGVVSHSLGDLGVSGTPTLLVVNGNGKVVYASVGLLDDARQKEVLEMLGGPGA